MKKRSHEPEALAIKAKRAFERMNDDLKSEYRSIRKQVETVEKSDGIGRFTIGERIDGIENTKDKHGTEAVKLLADALMYDESTLYNYGLVARAWTRPEFVEINHKAGRSPIHFSHFIAIAKLGAKMPAVEFKQVRDDLIGEVLGKGHSVRDLNRAIAKRLGKRGRATENTASFMASIERWLTRMPLRSDAKLRGLDAGGLGEALIAIEQAEKYLKQRASALREALRAEKGGGGLLDGALAESGDLVPQVMAAATRA